MKDIEMLRLDFNSLKLLKILGEEKNTKRAAERLFISQPAVSKSLKKLREQFNDQLFTRRLHGLEPTQKCEDLLAQLPDILSRLEYLFEQGTSFEPSTYTGEISIHLNTVLYHPIMGALFSKLTTLAPNATIRLENWSNDTEHKLKNNQADVGINFEPIELSKEIIQKPVRSSKIRVCCRKDHALVSRPEFTAEDIALSPLILMLMPDYNPGDNYSEIYLKSRGLTPKVLLRSDKMELCFDALRAHNGLLPVSEIVEHILPNDLTLLSLSHLDGIPDYSIGCFYSHRTRNSPYTLWLYDVVSSVINELLSDSE
jgi:DNA-binding transcriptional LysR family regulator